MPAILFGSISTIADTSELQREAFNRAFAAHGLDWTWDREDYRGKLATSGGRTRIAQQGEALGLDVDADAVHETKSAIFQESLSSAALDPRPGVIDTIKEAKDQGWKVGLITTTSRDNIEALLAALTPQVQPDDFDVIVDSTNVDQPKPDGAAYAFALEALGETAARCVAIEDNLDGVRSAAAAGLRCVAFPNENTAQHDFTAAERSVDRLDPAGLQQLAHSA